jgi:hypothetical protein
VTFIDIMGVDASRQSRWDKHDGETAVVALAEALKRAGLPADLLAAPKRLLAQAEALAAQARTAKDAARQRLDAANRALLADGPVDTAGYAAMLTETAPWLSADGPAMGGLMQAVAQIRGNATQVAFALAPSLYAELQKVCAEVVADAESVAALPGEVWSSTSSGQASELAVRAGRESDWAALTRAGIRWDAVHDAGQLLRETGQFQSQLNFSCPTALGVCFLNWLPAMDGLAEVQRLPGPLRLRAAIDRGWVPGLYLLADHERFADGQRDKPRRKLFAALAGRPTSDTTTVGDEFSA